VTADPSVAEHAARLAARAGEVALCLDFDGTLSPIVDDPQAARPLQGIIELLAPLAARFAAVALISGRPAAYLAEHARAPGVRYLGLYGLQEIRDGQVWVDPRLEAARGAVVAAHEDLKTDPAVQASGAWLEDKEYAVAVHTRRAADPDRWAAPIDQAARQIAGRHGLEVVPGKLVWELRPAVRSDKGDAVRRVVAESGAREVVVVGDDLGDLAAFAAAAEFTTEGRDGLRVAVRSAEAPPALLAEADLVVVASQGWCKRLGAQAPGGGYAAAVTASSITPSGVVGCSNWRRRSWSRRSALGVMVRPRHPRLARSRTAQTRLRQEASPGSRPMTLVRRRVSPKVRSMRLE
jgi:trehalose 6-phosphate phosphatase